MGAMKSLIEGNYSPEAAAYEMEHTHPNGKVIPCNYYDAEPKKFAVYYRYGSTWCREADCNDPVEWFELCRRNAKLFGTTGYDNASVMFSLITPRKGDK